jgi:hypothetical protein
MDILAGLGPQVAEKLRSLSVTNPDAMAKILNATATDPHSMWRFAEDIPPTAEPVGDYIADVERRCHLFEEFRYRISGIHGDGEDIITATTFACFMVAPIPELETYLSNTATITQYPGSTELYANIAAPFAIRACQIPFPI